MPGPEFLRYYPAEVAGGRVRRRQPEEITQEAQRNHYNDRSLNKIIRGFSDYKAERKPGGYSVWWMLKDQSKCQFVIAEGYQKRYKRKYLRADAYIPEEDGDWRRIGWIWFWRSRGWWLEYVYVNVPFRGNGVADGLLKVMDVAATGIGRRQKREVKRWFRIGGQTPEDRLAMRHWAESNGYTPHRRKDGTAVWTWRGKKRAETYIKFLYVHPTAKEKKKKEKKKE